MRIKLLILIPILLAACSLAPVSTIPAPATRQATTGASPSQPAAALPAATLPADTQSTPASGVAPTERAPLVFTVLSPLNNAVVGAAQLNFTGNVTRDTTLTINNDIYLLPAGDFSIPLTLDEGPNALEVVASDSDGNETDLILIVTYQP